VLVDLIERWVWNGDGSAEVIELRVRGEARRRCARAWLERPGRRVHFTVLRSTAAIRNGDELPRVVPMRTMGVDQRGDDRCVRCVERSVFRSDCSRCLEELTD